MGWFSRRRESKAGSDYSTIDSRRQLSRLARAGELVPLLLLPEIFGGDARDENVVFVPPFAANRKSEIDEQLIGPLAGEGKVTNYNAEPIYAGTSFVPTAIVVHAYGASTVHETIPIWGHD